MPKLEALQEEPAKKQRPLRPKLELVEDENPETEYFESEEQKQTDFFDYLTITVPETTKEQLKELLTAETIDFERIKELDIPNQQLFRIIKTTVKQKDLEIKFGSATDKLKYFFTKSVEVDSNSFDIYRLTKRLATELDKKTSIAYPAIGPDGEGYFDSADPDFIEEVYTWGIKKAHDEIGNENIKRNKIDAIYHNETFLASIEEDDSLSQRFDCLILDTTAFTTEVSGDLETFQEQTLDILSENGYILINKNHFDTNVSAKEFQTEDKLTDLIEKVAELGSNYLFKKK
jgi:hypothetical protein